MLDAPALAQLFAPPERVEVRGWADHLMEPFLSRDGRLLFFNNRNAPADKTDLHWAERESDLVFRYRGPVEGARSGALDAVASLSRDGTFVFTTTRETVATGRTLFFGRWTGDDVIAVAPPLALSCGLPCLLMDAEISAAGGRAYLSQAVMGGRPGGPKASDLRLALRGPKGWRIAAEADAWFARLNTDALEYAPATSPDERELYFTRLTYGGFLRAPALAILVAVRPDAEAAFGAPAVIPAIAGFVEAPTIAPDGALYFHQKIAGKHVLMRSARRAQRR